MEHFFSAFALNSGMDLMLCKGQGQLARVSLTNFVLIVHSEKMMQMNASAVKKLT